MDISVLMSCYKNDTPKSLAVAIDSVINQTYKPKQVVLVVDGTVTEELFNQLNHLKKRYSIINIVKLKENVGLGSALNEGAKYCKYDYIARMDSDDFSFPDRFKQEIEIFRKRPDLDVVGSFGLEFFGNGNDFIGIKKVPENDADIKSFMTARCPFCHMSVLMKKKALQKVGGYKDCYFAEDWYLWIRMALSGAKFYNIQSPLVKIKVDTNTYERRHGIKYYKSIKFLLKYMHKKHMMTFIKYLWECLIRFVGQVLVSKKLESLLYKKIIRKQS